MRLFSASMFLLPLLLIFGVVVQSGALYLFGIVLPAVALLGGLGSLQRAFPAIGIGAVLLTLYLVFPAANMWNIPRFYSENFVFSKAFLESQVTSGVFFSGVALVALSRFRIAPRGASPATLEQFGLAGLRWFLLGLLTGSVLLALFTAVEHFTGYTWRPFSHQPVPHQDGAGTFRPFGFYGGPLHLAGASLAWVSVAWFLFWRWFEARLCNSPDMRWSLRVFSSQWVFPVALVTIVVLQTWMVVMVAGRTAALVVFGVLAVLPLFVRLGRVPGMLRVGIGAGVASVGALAVACSPLGRRFLDIINEPLNPATSSTAQHLVNWQVHWELLKENVLLGNGAYWLDQFVRSRQYELMGYPANVVPHNNSHNIFLEALASVGLVGVVALVVAVVFGAIFLVRASRCHPLARSLASALLVAVVANAAHGFTENTFYSSNVAYIYLGILWAFVWVTACLARGEAQVMRLPAEEGIAEEAPRRVASA